MLDLHSALKSSPLFNKMEVNELLFVEYTCMREETKFGVWSDNNYFAFIRSGKKMWRSIYHSYMVNEGDIIFVKKGANLTHQFFDDEFCAIFMFIPDDFIQTFLKRHFALLDVCQKDLASQDSVLRVCHDQLLEGYCSSVQAYLALSEKPNDQLLLLKFEELLLSIFSNKKHKPLTDYFFSLCQAPAYNMSKVMEANFAYNLKLAEYARLCHMSLSTFKRIFNNYYHVSPSSWLKDRKLALSVHKLIHTDLPVGHISFNCGFEDTSHFIRIFKEKYLLTPLQYRQEHAQRLIFQT